MSVVVTQFDLKLANYVQDKGKIDFAACEELFGKSESTLKRSIYTLNEYIPDHLTFSISHHEIRTNMTYADFSALCQRLDMNDYSPSLEERLSLIVCVGLLDGIVNMTELYTCLNLSLSTKKKDRKELGFFLEQNGIEVVNRHRKGVSFEGNERFLRMIAARNLLSVIELNKNDDYVPRQANTPVQTLLFELAEQYLAAYHDKVKDKLCDFFGPEARLVDYPSKKFIYLHMMISLIRIEKGYTIKENIEDMPDVASNHLLPVEEDSDYLDYLIASLNYKEPLDFPSNNQIRRLTEELISTIEEKNEIQFYTYDSIYNELYAYFYKCLIKNKLAYYFYDDKLDDTKTVFPKLYEQVKHTVSKWAEDEGFELSDHQRSVVCLILERYIIKNRVAGQNNRRIVIITNSSVEKVSFFLEVLSQHVDYDMVSYLTINELYRLEEMRFDAILTFSNRITVLLSELGWESIKMNFYLTSDDIKRLLDHGFTSSRNKKLLAEEVVRQLETRSDTQDRISYLQTAFPDIMI